MGEVKPWHERDPGARLRLEHLVASAYPTLHVVVVEGLVHVRGTFPVVHESVEIDRFAIDIVLSREHPRELPAVYETGGKIPRTPKHHINSDGTACAGIPDVYWLENATGEVDLLRFLERDVHNYFLGQAAVRNGDPWPFGEWRHGGDGLLDHYSEVFGTPDQPAICHLLFRALEPMKGHLPCPCGSGRRYRNCHRVVVAKIAERVPHSVIRRSIVGMLESRESRAARGLEETA